MIPAEHSAMKVTLRWWLNATGATVYFYDAKGLVLHCCHIDGHIATQLYANIAEICRYAEQCQSAGAGP
jgi:hypothetical protein